MDKTTSILFPKTLMIVSMYSIGSELALKKKFDKYIFKSSIWKWNITDLCNPFGGFHKNTVKSSYCIIPFKEWRQRISVNIDSGNGRILNMKFCNKSQLYIMAWLCIFDYECSVQWGELLKQLRKGKTCRLWKIQIWECFNGLFLSLWTNTCEKCTDLSKN